MAIVASSYSFVVGVDTHAKTHTYAILDTRTGEILGCEQFPTTTGGITRALAWVLRRTGGETVLWVVEGIGTYGARLGNAVGRSGYELAEAPRVDGRTRVGVGKSDPLDAKAIAAAALSIDDSRLRRPRQDDGMRAALRVLLAAREQLAAERTMNVNALTALLRVHDLGVDARKPLTKHQIQQVSRWRGRQESLIAATAREEAIRLATRILEIGASVKGNQARMTELILESPAAPLLEMTGVGAATAAVVITAWSHPGRVRSEAAFASLAGVSPIPASSGNTVRHRLNRGGDRRLNRALHVVAITRMTHHPETRAYVEKRLAEGRTKREIRRCIKRYFARHLYRTLNALHTPTPAT